MQSITNMSLNSSEGLDDRPEWIKRMNEVSPQTTNERYNFHFDQHTVFGNYNFNPFYSTLKYINSEVKLTNNYPEW